MPRLLSLGAVALVIAVAVEGIWHRQSQEKAVAAWTDAAAIPAVDIVHPTKGAPGQQIVLPGDIHAWYEAPLYARVNGYLKNWYFDFGAQVKKGQVLADIDTPEIDAQLTAAKAKLSAASATEGSRCRSTVRQDDLHALAGLAARRRIGPGTGGQTRGL